MDTTTIRQYATGDRSYPAQIFNRMVFFNANSKATNVGRRYKIQAVYSSGERAQYYAGVSNYNTSWQRSEDGSYHRVVTSELPRNNFIGVELVRRTPFYDYLSAEERAIPLIEVYVDGYATVNYATLRYDLGYDMCEQVRDMFDAQYDTLGNNGNVILLRRKILCPAFTTRVNRHHTDIGDRLIQKYNIEGGTLNAL